MKKGLILLLLLCSLLNSRAQLVSLGNSLRVVEGGDTLLSPWAGGLNVPQLCPMDLDNDGVMDLLIYDRADDRLLPMRHVAGADYAFAPEFIQLFPTTLLSEWLYSADYDGDGYLDLFTGFQSSTVRVLRNTSAATGGSLSFAQVKFPLLTDYYPPGGALSGLYVARNDYSSFVDVDGDGDLDVLAFDIGGSYLNWYRNTSVENGWGLDSLQFMQQSACFGHFQEDASSCTATLDNTPCVTGIAGFGGGDDTQRISHVGSTLLAWNLNADGLIDVIVGDAGCDHLYALTNGGLVDTAHFVGLEVDFPITDTSVSIYTFPAAFAVDVDHDGMRDMIAAPNIVGTGEDIRSVWLYHNVGADNAPDLRLAQRDYMQAEMIELGSGAVPGLIDFDQDGDEDLVVGSLSRFVVPGESYSQLSLYLNEGTASLPVFVLHSRDWLGMAASELEGLSPCAGDLDGDGDDDLLLGTFDGVLMYFRNDALPGDTARMTLVSSNYQGLDAGLYSAPHLFDLDSDSDLDLLLGNHRGFVQYYRNTGSATAPTFTHITDSLGKIKLNDASGFPFTNGFSRPWIAQLDSDPGFELIVGGYTGVVEVFDHVTDAAGAKFPKLGPLGGDLDFGLYAAPLAGFPDALGQLRFLVGNYRGGLLLAEGGKPIHAQEALQPFTFEAFPNPAHDQVAILLPHAASTSLLDVNGRILWTKDAPEGQTELSLEEVPSGIYLLKAQTLNALGIQRLVVIR